MGGHKPSLRGHIKGYICSQEKVRLAQVIELENKARELEYCVSMVARPEVSRELTQIRLTLKQLLLKEARQCWRAST